MNKQQITQLREPKGVIEYVELFKKYCTMMKVFGEENIPSVEALELNTQLIDICERSEMHMDSALSRLYKDKKRIIEIQENVAWKQRKTELNLTNAQLNYQPEETA